MTFDFLQNELFPEMKKNTIHALLFYPPTSGKAIIININQLQDDIRILIENAKQVQ